MKKSLKIGVVCWGLATMSLLLSGCAKEFNQVYKTNDVIYKYEYAKESFARGKYAQASTLLLDVINFMKGREYAEESLYMLGMAQYLSNDYEGAAATFRKYAQTYQKGGQFTDLAQFYVGQSLYMSTPEPRLDQTETYEAIAAFQEFLDRFPQSSRKSVAQDRLFELQDKLVLKELYNAQLYYDLGPYFGNCGFGGNNFEACIITAENALKDYPYSSLREEFSLLIMKSKYELAQLSVESKRIDRYQDALDECYGFVNEYPDSKYKTLADRYIEKCKKVTEGAEENR
ncbi:MAG: outer membrane protein assembly factor BamD [Prevotella sp.]|jgi:outer membrane protein assembly factor BamD|nr:outer membrane protein assembly factor BamD [Prevotella sp.]